MERHTVFITLYCQRDITHMTRLPTCNSQHTTHMTPLTKHGSDDTAHMTRVTQHQSCALPPLPLKSETLLYLCLQVGKEVVGEEEEEADLWSEKSYGERIRQ